VAAVVPSLRTSTISIWTAPDEPHVAAPTQNVAICQHCSIAA